MLWSSVGNDTSHLLCCWDGLVATCWDTCRHCGTTSRLFPTWKVSSGPRMGLLALLASCSVSVLTTAVLLWEEDRALRVRMAMSQKGTGSPSWPLGVFGDQEGSKPPYLSLSVSAAGTSCCYFKCSVGRSLSYPMPPLLLTLNSRWRRIPWPSFLMRTLSWGGAGEIEGCIIPGG